ncbi:MAG: NAD(P)-binding domain-containing protein [Acidobacteria bacterium]|nr:NAD(P)-binding domain-containing protein [Acidobacteriota bacterium]
MKKSQLLIILSLFGLLLALNLLSGERAGAKEFFGGLPWYGWAGVSLFLGGWGVGFVLRDAARARRLLAATPPAAVADADAGRIRLTPEQIEKYDKDGPDYPHPVVLTEYCIGCHACVEACPHDVLAVINGYATVIARDMCMEDTSCQIECPVNPKACVVVNTSKPIPKRKVPSRDASFMTNVTGCFIVGDVSGTPLIKNAANEGADVIRHILDELAQGPPEPKAELDVAIIGMGPAGLSAAVVARQAGLRYVGVEQDTALATIEAYPANKYVHFKPTTMKARGGVGVEGAGMQREAILADWKRVMLDTGVRVNEFESCKAVRRAADGDYFVVQTERGPAREPAVYRARRVVLALGNRGTPMKLGVPGEGLKIVRDGRTVEKVQYRLSDPEAFRRRKIVVVGAGNSAVEAAVDLVARREGDQISFRPDSEINEVSLVIRGDLKNDLKFGNKQQVYHCIDEGKIKAHFGTAVKEVRDSEVVLMNARTKEDKGTIPNDFVFALIGGERPTEFLKSIGITIE